MSAALIAMLVALGVALQVGWALHDIGKDAEHHG